MLRYKILQASPVLKDASDLCYRVEIFRFTLQPGPECTVWLNYRNLMTIDFHLQFIYILKMARSDLVVSLVRASAFNDQKAIRETVEALVAEEHSKNHHLLAEKLWSVYQLAKN